MYVEKSFNESVQEGGVEKTTTDYSLTIILEPPDRHQKMSVNLECNYFTHNGAKPADPAPATVCLPHPPCLPRRFLFVVFHYGVLSLINALNCAVKSYCYSNLYVYQVVCFGSSVT